MLFSSTRLIGAAALLSGFSAALPRPDSAIGDEVAVSAPNGTPISDTAALATQTAISQTASADSTVVTSYSAGSGSGWSSQAWNTATALASSYSAPPSYGSASWSYSAPPSYRSAGSSWYSAPSYDSGSSSYVAPPVQSSASYSPPSYGSGSSSWSGENYNSCVQQCMASYGAPSAATYAPPAATYTPPTATSGSYGSSGSSGSSATHTIIVAPTQGVLRFVPFALNASVGDTLQFMWGANNHTVTHSSALTPCNKTLDNPFSSGEQNKGFVFTQVVNDTNPLFFYCGTPTHCEKGMFGIINPPNALGSPTSAANMMAPLASNDSSIAAYATYTNNMTANSTGAAEWGSSMDMSSMPAWSHSYIAEKHHVHSQLPCRQ